MLNKGEESTLFVRSWGNPSPCQGFLRSYHTLPPLLPGLPAKHPKPLSSKPSWPPAYPWDTYGPHVLRRPTFPHPPGRGPLPPRPGSLHPAGGAVPPSLLPPPPPRPWARSGRAAGRQAERPPPCRARGAPCKPGAGGSARATATWRSATSAPPSATVWPSAPSSTGTGPTSCEYGGAGREAPASRGRRSREAAGQEGGQTPRGGGPFADPSVRSELTLRGRSPLPGVVQPVTALLEAM